MLGLHSYLTAYGINYIQLAIFCLFGARVAHLFRCSCPNLWQKWRWVLLIINPNIRTREEQFLLEIVYSLARKAGSKTMPEVGIYNSPELNAFATGPLAKAHSLPFHLVSY